MDKYLIKYGSKLSKLIIQQCFMSVGEGGTKGTP